MFFLRYLNNDLYIAFTHIPVITSDVVNLRIRRFPSNSRFAFVRRRRDNIRPSKHLRLVMHVLTYVRPCIRDRYCILGVKKARRNDRTIAKTILLKSNAKITASYRKRKTTKEGNKFYSFVPTFPQVKSRTYVLSQGCVRAHQVAR